MRSLDVLLARVGEEVVDADEESFLLFARDIPSQNLGFIDASASTVEVSVHGHEFSIMQSPGVLASRRAGGTTGAVLWKISPLLAEWISAPQNLLRTEGVLTPSSAVVELGCGISGLIALCLAPSVGTYVATDQDYVSRWFRSNVEANATAALRLSEDLHRFQENDHQSSRNRRHREKRGSKLKVSVGKKTSRNEKGGDEDSHEKIGGGLGLDNIFFTPLDWELDDPSTLSVSTTEPDRTGFDVLISCDCIYNEALIPPFVRTCVDICRMRPAYQSTQDSLDGGEHRPTVCVIAQQQRSPEVFESWLRETLRFFRVWRVIDDALPEALRSGSGYLIHLLVLREEST